MPHFCHCCQPAHDTYVCQECGSVKCSGKHPSKWAEVPRSGRQGNLCPACQKCRPAANADVKIEVQGMFDRQRRIYPDACDVGIRVEGGKEPVLRSEVRALIQKHRPDISKWENGRRYNFGGFEISWNRDVSRGIEFLSYSD